MCQLEWRWLGIVVMALCKVTSPHWVQLVLVEWLSAGMSKISIYSGSWDLLLIRWFICRGCVNPVSSNSRTSVDNGVTANLELVDKFCYLGDMLSIDEDADAAVEARIQTGWKKLRQLVPLLTNKDISLIIRGRLYSSCVQSSMLHGSET